MVKIYALTDDTEGSKIRYIGRTIRSIKTRYWEYTNLFDRNVSRNNSWLKHIIQKENRLPGIIIIDEVMDSEADFWEYHYISLYRSWGFKLLNHLLHPITSGKVSEAFRERQKRGVRRSYKVISPARLANVKRTPVTLQKGEEVLHFTSITEAGKYLNVAPEHIRRVLYKKIKYNGSIYKSIKGYTVVPLI